MTLVPIAVAFYDNAFPAVLHLTDGDVTLNLQTFDTTLEFLNVGIPGPPGASGQGLTNAVTFTVATAGQQSLQLSGNINIGILTVNGLYQPGSYYSITLGLLTLPAAMGLLPGDIVSFIY